jgi:putative nucleotidyltransferase with HDIG domain
VSTTPPGTELGTSSHPLMDALRAMNGAVAAHRLYGTEHPATARAEDTAYAAIRGAFAAPGARGQIVVHALGPRVVGPDGPLDTVAALAPDVWGAMALHEFNSLCVGTSFTREELVQFVKQVCEQSPTKKTQLGTMHIVCGKHGSMSEMSDAHVQRAAAVTLTLLQTPVSTVQGAWQAAAQGVTGQAADAIFGVVDQMVSVIDASKGAMLELAALKDYDEYTFVHTVNVGLMAASLAEACGLSAAQVRDVTVAALLHDIGKQRTPLEVLNKRAPLDERERTIMNHHPVDGGAILIGNPSVPAICSIVAFEHHMYLNGTGYPQRSSRWKPHLSSQIVQLADIFDALRTHRPYRAAMGVGEAVKVLEQGAGTKHDADLVKVFSTRVVPRAADDRPAPQAAQSTPETKAA